jgi:hypothetical protein
VPLSAVELSLGLALLLALGIALFRAVALPLEWDGLSLWQFKARALADGSLRYQLTDRAFAYSHVDYPLLVPAHTWWLPGGGAHAKGGQLGGLLFLADLMIVFFWGARSLPRAARLVGALVLASLPITGRLAAIGFADLPLAAYFLAMIVAWRDGDVRIVSLLAMGTVLTKNEGLFALASMLAVCLLASPPETTLPLARRLRETALVLLAGGAALGTWLWVGRQWGLTGDMLTAANVRPERLWQGVDRLPRIGRTMLHHFTAIGPGVPGWGLLWLAAALGLLTGPPGRWSSAKGPWIAAGTYLLLVVTPYALTPHDLGWHLSTSLARLLYHAAPVTLLAGFLTWLPGAPRDQPDHVSQAVPTIPD